ncbi:MAG: response regulator [Thermodesulfobacteriota bacterium]
MNTVLIVDDDKSFLLSLIDGFKAYEDRFAIVTAHDGAEAVKILGKKDINLVLTDLKMPNMDGFELVAHLSSHHPEVPVIVMTAFGTPEMENNLKDMGAFQYIEKPINFSTLVEKILKGLESTSKGFITGVSLTSFLQLLELDHKTCTLSIRAGVQQGTMYFRDGQLLDAATENLTAKEAAFEIVSWSDVSIEINNSCRVDKSTIQESLGFILLEGSRRHDERGAENPEVSSPVSNGTVLEDIDVDDIDLDLTSIEATPSEATPAAVQETAQLQQAEPVDSANEQLTQFTVLLGSMAEIIQCTIVSRNGDMLYQSKGADNQVGDFITYVAVAAEQVRMALGATGRQYTLFNQTNGENLLVVCGEAVIVGLTIKANTLPDPIADSLRPILNRITL